MKVHLTIDGRTLQVEKGLTVLQAARANDIRIPTLCDYPTLPANGSCRLCLVEIEGRASTPPSCTLPVEEGLVVHTQTPKIRELRSEILQQLLSEHPSCCLFCPNQGTCEECMRTLRKAGITTGCRSCPKDEQCEIQEIVKALDVQSMRYPVRYRALPVERRDPFFDRDDNLCVLCGRCVRVCEEKHFSSTLTFKLRGPETVVGTAFGRSHLEAGCSFCGACVEACPTGAFAEKTRKWDGKPENETLTTCPLCSLGCSLRLLSKNDQVIGSLPAQMGGDLCVKGRFGITELVDDAGRLKHASMRIEGRQIRLGWEEAIHQAAEKLSACLDGQFELVVSASCTNEELYLASKLAHQVMKSNRVFSPACNAYGDGLEAVTRLLERSQPLQALEQADVILCLGLDGRYAQSVVEMRLKRAHRRGARLVTVYRGRHSLGKYADAWLEPQPGQETSLVQALAVREGKAAAQIGLEKASAWLHGAAHPLLVIGPAFLAHPDNRALLAAVERLADEIKAQVLALPAEGNLASAFRLGANPLPQAGATASVQYWLGETPPVSQSPDTFVIYQNISPPRPGCLVNLTLPAAAFSELEGTLTDQAGQMRAFHLAVPPPGEALPGWQIICRIAQALGAPGFDYANVAEVTAEWLEQSGKNAPARSFDHLPRQAEYQEHTYLGFPLTDFVSGLRSLYPLETSKLPQMGD